MMHLCVQMRVSYKVTDQTLCRNCATYASNGKLLVKHEINVRKILLYENMKLKITE